MTHLYDPRVFSFIAIQIHYWGQVLLERARVQGRSWLCRYIHLVEDQLHLTVLAERSGCYESRIRFVGTSSHSALITAQERDR